MTATPFGRGNRLACGLQGLLFALATACSAGAAGAEGAPAQVASPVETAFSAVLVKTGLYMLSGSGGNSLLRLSASGSVLVDGQPPASYRALMSQVRKISRLSDLPVRVLIPTNHHPNHTGDPARFGSAGVALIVQRNAVQRLVLATPAPNAKSAPVVAFDGSYDLRIGGVEARLLHFGHARTDADTIVHFPDLRVVAVGDLFTRGRPEPDFQGGGSLAGWSLVLAKVLELDFDIVVPGSGPLATRDDLVAFKSRIDAVVLHARALINQGAGKERLFAELATSDAGWKVPFDADQADRLYSDLAQAPQ